MGEPASPVPRPRARRGRRRLPALPAAMALSALLLVAWLGLALLQNPSAPALFELLKASVFVAMGAGWGRVAEQAVDPR